MEHAKRQNKDLNTGSKIPELFRNGAGYGFKTSPPPSFFRGGCASGTWRGAVISEVLAFMEFSYLAFVPNLRICSLSRDWKALQALLPPL